MSENSEKHEFEVVGVHFSFVVKLAVLHFVVYLFVACVQHVLVLVVC